MVESDETSDVSCPTCNGTGRVKPLGDEDKLVFGGRIRVMGLRKPRE